MTSVIDPISDYMQARRVITRVCLANEDLSHEERLVLASSVGGASNLPAEQIQVLLRDTTELPDVDVLMKAMTHAGQYRQILIDLAALAVVKQDWHDSELAAARKAIGAFPLDEPTRSALSDAFEALRRASTSLA
jgi:hypothetical protein